MTCHRADDPGFLSLAPVQATPNRTDSLERRGSWTQAPRHSEPLRASFNAATGAVPGNDLPFGQRPARSRQRPPSDSRQRPASLARNAAGWPQRPAAFAARRRRHSEHGLRRWPRQPHGWRNGLRRSRQRRSLPFQGRPASLRARPPSFQQTTPQCLRVSRRCGCKVCAPLHRPGTRLHDLGTRQGQLTTSFKDGADVAQKGASKMDKCHLDSRRHRRACLAAGGWGSSPRAARASNRGTTLRAGSSAPSTTAVVEYGSAKKAELELRGGLPVVDTRFRELNQGDRARFSSRWGGRPGAVRRRSSRRRPGGHRNTSDDGSACGCILGRATSTSVSPISLVHHAAVRRAAPTRRKRALRSVPNRTDAGSTEDLRQAVVHYRALFFELLAPAAAEDRVQEPPRHAHVEHGNARLRRRPSLRRRAYAFARRPVSTPRDLHPRARPAEAERILQRRVHP